MKKELVRLALVQMTFVIYSILGIGVLLKLRYGSAAPANLFATYLRDYGFVLLFFPSAWCVWAMCDASKPASERPARITPYASGLALAGLLAVISLFGTMSAMTHDSVALLQTPHAISDRQSLMEP